MLAKYHRMNRISLQHFDQTIFEEIITIFDIEYFINIGRMWGMFFLLK
jgi:hypothetical protein